ncbi:glycoside hydrolase 43 family protein [Arachidicoccus terrestris]|nr:glycoside hydrolase 43 family protein [Arachidicoccus terrestris]
MMLCVSESSRAQKKYVSRVWTADNGDGTYRNPILFADYSDPDVMRIGDDYYLVSSSFNCTPGLPILHSRDLVNWTFLTHALPGLPDENHYRSVRHGKGVWAPSFSRHNEMVYIYYPDPDYGVFMIKARSPEGPWSAPVLVLKGKGIIDPSVLWDNDGKAYMAVAWAASRAGVNSLITVFQLNSEGTKVVDGGRHVYDGHDLDKTVEGPKLYKRNGYYYIFCPAGGVSTGWQLVLRSRSIYGPYKRKIVMAQGKSSINGPHQGAWVHTASGEDWFVHFQDKGAYGRVTLLEPMVWKDDWPIIGIDKDGDGCGEPVTEYKKPLIRGETAVQTPQESDEFDDGGIGPQWQWQANSEIQWSVALKNTGYLRLFAYPSDTGKNLYDMPNLLLQKFPAPDFSATTKVKWNIEFDEWQGKKAGLIISGDSYAYISVRKQEDKFYVDQVVCREGPKGARETVVDEQQVKDSIIFMRVDVNGPDAVCSFSYSEDGKHFRSIGKPFKAHPDLWIGAKVGLFCTSRSGVRTGGYADFDYFRIDPLQERESTDSK